GGTADAWPARGSGTPCTAAHQGVTGAPQISPVARHYIHDQLPLITPDRGDGAAPRAVRAGGQDGQPEVAAGRVPASGSRFRDPPRYRPYRSALRKTVRSPGAPGRGWRCRRLDTHDV